MAFERISAVTLGTTDMAASVAFYEKLGFELLSGGHEANFSTFAAGQSYLNLVSTPSKPGWWGRVIFYVDDVDALHSKALAAGLEPETEPADASWGERYFHILDPDGHELSVARPLQKE